MSTTFTHDSPHRVFVRGEVEIADGVAIAPGVLLQAEVGGRLLIAEGVCIGENTVVHVYEGTLEIQAGAVLGAGVLIVGSGLIGMNACIGAAATLRDPQVETCQIIPAGALVGEGGRQILLNPESGSLQPAVSSPTESPASPVMQPESLPQREVTQTYPYMAIYPLYSHAPTQPTSQLTPQPLPQAVKATPASHYPYLPAYPLYGATPPPPAVEPPPPPDYSPIATSETPPGTWEPVTTHPPAPTPSAPVGSMPEPAGALVVPEPERQVYGQAYLNHLLGTLLPHRRQNGSTP